MSLAPTFASGALLAADALYATGDIEQAQFHYRHFMELSPENIELEQEIKSILEN